VRTTARSERGPNDGARAPQRRHAERTSTAGDGAAVVGAGPQAGRVSRPTPGVRRSGSRAAAAKRAQVCASQRHRHPTGAMQATRGAEARFVTELLDERIDQPLPLRGARQLVRLSRLNADGSTVRPPDAKERMGKTVLPVTAGCARTQTRPARAPGQHIATIRPRAAGVAPRAAVSASITITSTGASDAITAGRPRTWPGDHAERAPPRTRAHRGSISVGRAPRRPKRHPPPLRTARTRGS